MVPYPKITSEQFEAAVQIVLGVQTQNKYLDKSPYSDNFRSIITFKVDELVSNLSEITPEVDLPDYLKGLSAEDTDNFDSLSNIESAMKTVKQLAKSASTESVKMNASIKIMELEQTKIAMLEKLKGIGRVEKIENLTRQFFREITNDPNLKDVGDRYLKLLDNAGL